MHAPTAPGREAQRDGGEEQEGEGSVLKHLLINFFSVVHKSKHSYKIQMSVEVLQWVYKIYMAR